MRAMILAAGLGTRLRPLTDRMPKPLVPVLGKPMIEYPLFELEKFGIQEVLVNVHYLPEKMRAFAAEWNRQGRIPKIILQDESDLILNSGGGVKKASSWLFQESSTALIYNSDVIAFPNLNQFHSAHSMNVKSQGALLTMAVIEHPLAGIKYNGVVVKDQIVVGFEKNQVHKQDLFHFPGFYFFEKSAFQFTAPGAPVDFSILECLWNPLIREKKLFAWTYQGIYLDLGSPLDLREAEIALLRKQE